MHVITVAEWSVAVYVPTNNISTFLAKKVRKTNPARATRAIWRVRLYPQRSWVHEERKIPLKRQPKVLSPPAVLTYMKQPTVGGLSVSIQAGIMGRSASNSVLLILIFSKLLPLSDAHWLAPWVSKMPEKITYLLHSRLPTWCQLVSDRAVCLCDLVSELGTEGLHSHLQV